MRTSLWFAVLAVGCGGGNFCEREYCGEPLDDASIEECNTLLETCSGADVKKLNAFFDCFEEIPGYCGTEETGETTTGLEGLGDILACTAELEGLSPECEAISTGVDTTFSTSTSF